MALYTVTTGNIALAADLNQIVNLLNGSTTGVDVIVSSRIRAQLAGATAASGYVGGVASGPPTTANPFLVGDFSIDQTGVVWVCTAAGSPGTWVKAGVALGSAGPHDVKASGTVGSSANASHEDHEHGWATMIAAALSWASLQTFTSGIALPSFNGSSYAGTAYPAVIAYGSKARQIFTAASRSDANANAGDILMNA